MSARRPERPCPSDVRCNLRPAEPLRIRRLRSGCGPSKGKADPMACVMRNLLRALTELVAMPPPPAPVPIYVHNRRRRG